MEEARAGAVPPSPSAVQFPTDDDGIDCPDALDDDNDDQGMPQRHQPLLVNGHAVVDGAPLVQEQEGSPRSARSSSTSASPGGRGKGKERRGRAPQTLGSKPNVCWERNDLGSSDDDEDDGDEEVAGVVDQWKMDDGAELTCDCIICNHQTTGYEAADAMKAHIEGSHDLSFAKLKTTFRLNYPSFVQFVRWAREQKREGKKVDESIRSIGETPPGEVPWSLDKYLLPPTKEGGEPEVDYFLTLDYFACEDHPDEAGPSSSDLSVEELVAQVQQLKVDKQRMTEVFQRILSEGKTMGGGCSRLSRGKKDPVLKGRRCEEDEESEALRQTRLQGFSSQSIGESPSNAQLYFDSYNETSIHHEMVFDHARTEAYRLAIAERAIDIKGSYVMDVGCGTGILSMFCAQYEPLLVFAMEKSNIIFDAMSNGFENNFESKIRYCHKDIDKEELPCALGKIDVLVSEFMGYFLFFEGMTETFIKARDKYLSPGGIMLPDACAVELVPLGPTGLFKSKVECWNDAYGFRMPALQSRTLNETWIETVNAEEIIGTVAQVKYLNLRTCKVEDIGINSDFTFQFLEDSEFCAIAGYFYVDFEGVNNKITLSTSPFDPPTHWKQAVFFLPKHFAVKAGQTMDGHITSQPHRENPRWLVVTITIGNLTQKYEFR